jgi:hypothetical protein
MELPSWFAQINWFFGSFRSIYILMMLHLECFCWKSASWTQVTKCITASAVYVISYYEDQSPFADFAMVSYLGAIPSASSKIVNFMTLKIYGARTMPWQLVIKVDSCMGMSFTLYAPHIMKFTVHIL